MSQATITAPVALATGAPDDLAAVEGFLARFFDEQVGRAGTHGPSYRQLWSAARDAASGGKRIRPRLLLAAHRAYAGTSGPDPDHAAVAAAAAFELLHTAFLMHDDVIDHDEVRRGRPNVTGRFAAIARAGGANARSARDFGEASAILAGDLLISAAHRLVAGLDVPEARRAALLDLVDECVFLAAAGEHADVRFALEGTPAAGEILAMVEHKTASYSFSAPLQAGALLAGAGGVAVGRLGDIGRDLGVAFQLRDDVLGVFGEEALTGKTAIGDLREGKQTLLVAHASTDASWSVVAGDFGRADLDEARAAAIRSVIVASGALERVERLIAARCRAAVELASASGLPAGLADELAATARACGERDR
ncbi:polyprenyl synthetase family protein [Agromyces sp. CFH 90414]|uniref:Polyprenyl synthetase family protein n=1 Tax=Agromyces agglutinans TaxID=2662258 RepID=A0A6I2F5E4_9MICO|nr:polyprenyl synthetase family protein [Agromyces agglutinans]MRG59819.1 polyprenyl synthetase family protein [Agromyces agglutinans]